MSKQSQFFKRQLTDKKRGEYTRARKRKFAYLRHTNQYERYRAMKLGRKPVKEPPREIDLVPIGPGLPGWKRFLISITNHVKTILRSLWR